MISHRASNSEFDNLASRLLEIAAGDLEPRSAIRQILDYTVTELQVSRAVVVVLIEPREVIVSDGSSVSDDWLSSISSLAQEVGIGLFIKPITSDLVGPDMINWLLGVMKGDNVPIALLWVEATTASTMDMDAQQENFAAVMNALTIASRAIHAQSARKHQTRNQVDFMRIVAHDLRSPLTSMRGFLNMIGEVGELNQQQTYYIEKVDSGIQQLALMVDNFQDAGRYDPETGFYEMQRGPCDVTEIVQRIVGNYLVPAEKVELTVTTRIADGIPIVNADQIMLERAVTNLVDNAIKYTPNGGRVEVGVDVSDQEIVISVKDNGYGIKPEDQTNIFDRHVRVVRKEYRRVKGSGLGLFIVRSVAQRHSGNAWVESEEGNGTTFFISLPLGGDNMPNASRL